MFNAVTIKYRVWLTFWIQKNRAVSNKDLKNIKLEAKNL
jgi:hypothetical protein